ncbi:MAG: hypothetical protein ACFFD4_37170 [Candidatus Odinarchaeota archaeon]
MASLTSRMIKNENFSLYVYLGVIVSFLLVLAFNILRHLDILLAGNPRPPPFGEGLMTDPLALFYKPPDIFLVIYVLTIIAGSYTVYRLIRFYLDVRSVDYLLIAFFVFGTIVYFTIWQLWLDYLSPFGLFIQDPYFVVGYVFESENIYPEIFVSSLGYFWGYFILLIILIRLRPWKDYHPVVKGVLLLVIIESTFNVIKDIAFNYIWPIMFSPEFTTAEYIAEYTSLPLSFTMILNILLADASLSTILVYYPLYIMTFLSVIIAFLTIKPEIETTAIRISRFTWIVFGVVKLLEPLNAYLTGIVSAGETYFVAKEIVIIVAFLSTLFLLSLLATVPEALLITNYQLMRAKNLYAIYESEQEREKGGILSILDNETRL